MPWKRIDSHSSSLIVRGPLKKSIPYLSSSFVGIRRLLARGPRSIVVQFEQRDDAPDVSFAANRIADPAGLGINMMRLRAPGVDERFPHEQRKREIRELAAVQVPELAAADTKFGPAEPVPARRHARPGRHLPNDRIANGTPHRRPLT